MTMVGGSVVPISAELAICVVLPSLFMLAVFSMCVRGCCKKKSSSHASDDAELNNGDAANGGSCKTVEVDLSNEANSRPLSHERALPEIPAIPSGVTSTDDDEEDDEGHYDIISKGKKMSIRNQPSTSTTAAVISMPSAASSSKKKARSHPYEKVHGDPDSDSVYAGIKDEFGIATNYDSPKAASLHGRSYVDSGGGAGKSGGANSGVLLLESLPSADSIGSNLYATVGTGNDSCTGGKASYVKDSFPRAAQGLAMTVPSSDVLGSEASTSSVGVGMMAGSQKMFEAGEEGGPVNGRLSVGQSDSSPSLPPRNCGLAAAGSTGGGSQAGDGIVGAGGGGIGFGGLIPSMAPWTTMAAYPSLIIDISDDGSGGVNPGASQAPNGATVSAKRFPDYSSVTARESLESLRKRQQQQQAHQLRIANFPDIDGTYDTINYDQVKVQTTVSRATTSFTAENTYNNGSDLYAEIATETNSARSSTYAKVGDLSTSNISDCCPLPPAPPSVNTLQQLTNASLDDHVDPGYSRVDVQRPRSIHYAPGPDPHPTTNIRSPVYAVVNKPANPNRQTIHVDENIDWGLRRNGENDASANLYAKVSKPKNHRRTSSSGASFGTNEASVSGASAAFGGARPKVRGAGHIADLGRGDHGYATIDNVVNGVNREDPDYDVVGDGNSVDGIPEYDPNYESVAVAPVASGTSLWMSVNSGVAREIVPNGIITQPRQQSNQSRAAAPPWHHHPRREHIYEVVKDSTAGPTHGISNNSSNSHTTDL